MNDEWMNEWNTWMNECMHEMHAIDPSFMQGTCKYLQGSLPNNSMLKVNKLQMFNKVLNHLRINQRWTCQR